MIQQSSKSSFSQVEGHKTVTLNREIVAVLLFRGKSRIWLSQAKRRETTRLLSGRLVVMGVRGCLFGDSGGWRDMKDSRHYRFLNFRNGSHVGFALLGRFHGMDLCFPASATFMVKLPGPQTRNATRLPHTLKLSSSENNNTEQRAPRMLEHLAAACMGLVAIYVHKESFAPSSEGLMPKPEDKLEINPKPHLRTTSSSSSLEALNPKPGSYFHGCINTRPCT